MTSRFRRPGVTKAAVRSVRFGTGKSPRGKDKDSTPVKPGRFGRDTHTSKGILVAKQPKVRERSTGMPPKKRGRPPSAATTDHKTIAHCPFQLADQSFASTSDVSRVGNTIELQLVHGDEGGSIDTCLPPVHKVGRLAPIEGCPESLEYSKETVRKRHEKPEKEERRVIRDDRRWMKEVAYREHLLRKTDPFPNAKKDEVEEEVTVMVVRDNKIPRGFVRS